MLLGFGWDVMQSDMYSSVTSLIKRGEKFVTYMVSTAYFFNELESPNQYHDSTRTLFRHPPSFRVINGIRKSSNGSRVGLGLLHV
jgi:hypothetical protein